MHQDSRFADVIAACAAGRFSAARDLLLERRQELQRADGLLFSSLLMDLELTSGNLNGAETAARKLLRDTASASFQARAHRVIAEATAHALDFESSFSHYSTARALCRTGVSRKLRATIELSFWGRFSGVLPMESFEAEFSTVRKAVAQSAHPHQIAELRLCAARVEARKGSLLEAHRHWELAQRLVERNPNLKLQAQLHLDGCMISLLRGHLRSALDLARTAASLSEESGYFRGAVAALIDQGHVLHFLGELEDARRLAEVAVSRSGEHRQLRVAALDCLGNILLAEGNLAGADAAFEQITHLRPQHGTRLAPQWDVLSELSSRVSLAKVRQSDADRDSLVAQGLRTAT